LHADAVIVYVSDYSQYQYGVYGTQASTYTDYDYSTPAYTAPATTQTQPTTNYTTYDGYSTSMYSFFLRFIITIQILTL